MDGELPNPQVPIIPGHEIVGRIDVIGAGVAGLRVGERVGIPARKISAIALSSPGLPATAVSQRRRSPMRAMRSHSAKLAMTLLSPLCSALA